MNYFEIHTMDEEFFHLFSCTKHALSVAQNVPLFNIGIGISYY